MRLKKTKAVPVLFHCNFLYISQIVLILSLPSNGLKLRQPQLRFFSFLVLLYLLRYNYRVFALFFYLVKY